MAKASALTGKQKKTMKAANKSLRNTFNEVPKNIQGLEQQYQQAGTSAKNIFEPIKQNALAEFSQYGVPNIVNDFGRNSGPRSSALNQALAAARTNLSRQLSADLFGIQSGLVNQNNQNQLQTGALAQGAALQNPYRQQNGPGGANKLQSALGGAIQGGIQGAAVGGPWGALAGAGIGATGGYFGAQGDYSNASQAGGQGDYSNASKAGAQGDYSNASKAGGEWLQKRFGSTPGGT
jgi:hypothetical protein